MLVFIMVLFKYMKSLNNGVHELFGTTLVRNKIYREFHHDIVCIVNGRCHNRGRI